MSEQAGTPTKKPSDVRKEQRQIELTVIAFAMAWPEKFYEIEGLDGEHFLDASIRNAFNAFKKANQERGAGALGAASVCASVLMAAGFSETSAFALLTEAADFTPGNPSAITSVCERLTNGKLRRAIALASDALRSASELPTTTIDELVSLTSGILTDAIRTGVRLDVGTLHDAMQEEITRLEAIERGDFNANSGYKTGLATLDEIINGCKPGEMIVIAARPSMGKSSLLNHLAVQFSSVQAVPGVIFSLEMKRQEYARRVICNQSGCNLQKATLGALNAEERGRYVGWAQKLSKAPLFIHDGGNTSMGQISAVTRRLYHEFGVRWVGVDYLQLVNHLQGKNETKDTAITRTSVAIKALARSLDIPVIAVAQLNRDCERRDDHRPRLSDLRDSGSIEQDADVVMFLHRDDYYHANDPEWAEENPDKVGVAEIIVSKQRNGPIGSARVVWRAESASFHDYSPYREEAPIWTR